MRVNQNFSGVCTYRNPVNNYTKSLILYLTQPQNFATMFA